jgi:hypothetical protein
MASSRKATASDVGDFEARMSDRIAALGGIPEPAFSAHDQRAALRDAANVFSAVAYAGGETITLDVIDGGRIVAVPISLSVPTTRAMLPVIAELVQLAASASDGKKVDSAVFLDAMKASLACPADSRLVAAVSRLVGSCFGQSDDWMLDHLPPHSAVRALEVALGLVPLGQLLAAFQSLVARGEAVAKTMVG